MEDILLATDLDRTLLPNGDEKESPQARELFKAVVARPEVHVIYISGRTYELLHGAIKEYDIPVAEYLIGYVSTVIYQPRQDGTWQELQQWHQEIAPDWAGKSWEEVHLLFSDVSGITLQEANLQSPFKVSYYADEKTDHKALRDRMYAIAQEHGLSIELLWSVDPQKHKGLLDVLPKSATKLHALQFVREHMFNIPPERTVFCGDSGNDIPALISGLNAVMVKNTNEETQREVMVTAKEKGITENIYTAQGDFLGMNGNYAAGVLEGLAHFFPETQSWMH